VSSASQTDVVGRSTHLGAGADGSRDGIDSGVTAFVSWLGLWGIDCHGYRPNTPVPTHERVPMVGFVSDFASLRAVPADKRHVMEAISHPNPRIGRAQIQKAAVARGILGGTADNAARIMAALGKPEIDAQEIVTLLKRENVLAARVLRVANSPYYGQPKTIATIDRALLVLGVSGVRGIAAAACLDRTLNRGASRSLLDMRAVLRHSLATAMAAECLARIRCPSLIAEAFMAGLLHNLGILVQLCLDRPGVDAMIRARRADDRRDMRMLEAERSAVGHEFCAAVLFEAWQMPETLIAAVQDHHDPMAASENHQRLACLINLGSQLALETGSTFALEPHPMNRNISAIAALDLNEKLLDGVASGLPARLAELSSALS
jgi:HD-like signal output (HDOD) protein